MKLGDLEYVDGQLVISSNVSNALVSNIYDKKQIGVMSNEPIFNEQLKLNCFWEHVDEKGLLPGSNQPVDLFVRASYYSKKLQKNILIDNEALAGVLSVMLPDLSESQRWTVREIQILTLRGGQR